EQSGVNGQFIFTRTHDLSRALTVRFTLSGTAEKGVDYTEVTREVHFNAGESEKSVSITPIDDTEIEQTEKVTIILSLGIDYFLGNHITDTIDLIDNDSQSPATTPPQQDAIVLSSTTTTNVTSVDNFTSSISIPITAGIDDVEEKPTQQVIIGSKDLDLVRSGGNQTVGLRFNGLEIPQGASIVSAYIQFTASSIRIEPTVLTIEGEAAGNAATFARVNGNVSSRQRTFDNIQWIPQPWLVIGESGSKQQTPDISSLLQEIIDHPDWSINNSAVIIMTGTGKRDAYSFESKSSAAPVLFVEFSNGNTNQPPKALITSPADGTNFTVGNNISFTGTGSDTEDGSVTASLAWYSNIDGFLATGGSFSTAGLTEGTHVITATATDSNAKTNSYSITVDVLPPGEAKLISIPIQHGTDDVEERSSGRVILYSRDIDLVRSGGNQTIGLRFNDVTIPQGSTVIDAYIQFTASNTKTEATDLFLEGEDVDNADAFRFSNDDVSNRPRTLSSVAWSPPAWTKRKEAGTKQQTPDLTPIVQEIIDRSGWENRNSMAFIITGSGKREAYSFEGNQTYAPVLHIEYQ
ncbi:MAG TPA: hypothetical protein ENJ32_03570, partial [Crenotrichaceae bacterium]|nr:hypothetical protein [Crenotrichaceae bacterium]